MTTEAIGGYSLNITEEKRQQLKQLFPEVFTEGTIDFTKLKAVLGELVTDAKEHYGLSWAGKYDAFREIQKQTTCTLVPDREGSIDFDTTGNIFIEGENLEVLRVLQKSYYGRVKMIYIDPPYNTGNDSFIYPDDFAERLEEYQRRAGIKDEDGFLNKQDLWKKNTRENGQFHSVWLSMMYPRLYLAKNLLQEDGVIFVSIDDTEVANLRLLMNEIFGEENFVESIIWKKRSSPPNDKIIGATHDYILIYAKSIDAVKLNLRERTVEQVERYRNPDNHPKGPWTSGDLMANVKGGRYVESLYFPIVNPNTGEAHYPSSNGNWRFNQQRIQELLANNEIYFGEDGKGRPKLKRFLSKVKEGTTYPTLWDFVPLNATGSSEMAGLLGVHTIFDNPKPVRLIQELLKLGASRDGVVMDFFAGSGSTAHAVFELNREDGGDRKFICVQLPEQTDKGSEARKAGYETIADVAKARIRKAIEQMKTNESGKLGLEMPGDRGFRSYTLVPSNFKIWRNAVEEAGMSELLLEFQEAHRPGTEADNMLTELLLKAGLPLTTPVERAEVDGGTVYRINGGALVVILEQINDDIRDYLLDTRPQHVICLDRIFNDNDQLLTNLGLQLREAEIELTVL